MKNTAFLLLFTLQLACGPILAQTAPAAVMPAKPTAAKAAFSDLEIGMFIHFDITSREGPRASGQIPASQFNPTELNCEQWMQAAKALGAKYAVLTARHAADFCLWPSKTTEYTLSQSPYKEGKGDIVREFVDACRRNGIKPGLYLGYTQPLWQSREQRAIQELTEVLTTYGPLYYVWMDFWGTGPDAEAPTSPTARYWKTVTETAHKLQPDLLIMGAEIEHGGNESGFMGYPMWNPVDTPDGSINMIGTVFNFGWENTGKPLGKLWRPRELPCTSCFSAGGWFWRGARDPKPLEDRLETYYRTVGHGANVIINMPPDNRGVIPENLVAAAGEMRKELERRFSTPVAQREGSGDTVELDLKEPKTIDHAILMENIVNGQKISRYFIEARVNGRWTVVADGLTVGHKKIDRFRRPVTTDAVRFRCLDSIAKPVELRSFALFDTR
ncbi:MAG TPA: alpha-L-fucosidase [Bryobacteraceae bacterium]|nr:alpha-L-fucosidase [Bryobacteraceae bacterium]